MKWPDFKFPAINLWSAPKTAATAHECGPFVVLHSLNIKICHECGKEYVINERVKIKHQR